MIVVLLVSFAQSVNNILSKSDPDGFDTPISISLIQMNTPIKVDDLNKYQDHECTADYCDLYDYSKKCNFVCQTSNISHYFEYTFKGEKFHIYGTYSKVYGTFAVYLDEVQIKIVDLSLYEQKNVSVFQSDKLPYRNHTVRIQVVSGTIELYKLVFWPTVNAKKMNTYGSIDRWSPAYDDFGKNLFYCTSSSCKVIKKQLNCSKIWVYAQKDTGCGSIDIAIDNKKTYKISEESSKLDRYALVLELDLESGMHDIIVSTLESKTTYFSCIYFLKDPYKPEVTSSYYFSESADFTQSNKFSISSSFSESADFTQSNKFSTSSSFSESADFTQSNKFSTSSLFSESADFTQSSKFSTSSLFSESADFTQSSKFSTSSLFSESADFTQSSKFSASPRFSKSTDFTQSNCFSASFLFKKSSGFESFKLISNSIDFSTPFQFSKSFTLPQHETKTPVKPEIMTSINLETSTDSEQLTSTYTISEIDSKTSPKTDADQSAMPASKSAYKSNDAVTYHNSHSISFTNPDFYVASKSHKAKAGLIPGIVAAVIALLIGIIILIIYIRHKKKNKEETTQENSQIEMPSAGGVSIR